MGKAMVSVHRGCWAQAIGFMLSVVVFCGSGPSVGAETVNIGALNDMSAATADGGKAYARGIAEAVRYMNDKGGVNGKKIKLYQFDYGYRVPEVITKYKLFKRLQCVAVLGWGTADTQALRPTVTQEMVPYVSGSYSARLTDPRKTPYHLFAATDYSSNARAALTAWFDTRWARHADFGKRKPRLQCLYMFAWPNASAPIKALKDHAALLGFELGSDQDVSLFAIETKRQVLAMKAFKPDLVWHGNPTISVAVALRDARSLGLETDHIVSNLALGENLPRLAGEAAEGVMGASVCAFYGEETPLMPTVVAYGKKYNPGIPVEKRTVRTIQGWSNALALWEALKRADKAGSLDGRSILENGFETLQNVDLGLGGAPLNYTSTDHRISGKVPIYEIQGGKMKRLLVVDLQSRWPQKWEKEWLGW